MANYFVKLVQGKYPFTITLQIFTISKK